MPHSWGCAAQFDAPTKSWHAQKQRQTQRPSLSPRSRFRTLCTPIPKRHAPPARNTQRVISCSALPTSIHGAWPALVHAGHSIQQAAENEVLAATSSASFKLIFICGVVGWMLKTGKLPKATSSVLTQVAYTGLIPCMLFTKCAATLASNRSMVLIGLPLVAILQVLAGSVIGWLASLTIPHSSPTTAKEFQGWHPNNPARSASVMAATTAAATGVRHAASALMPSPINPPEGTRQLVLTCCAFGNSVTLPLVFLLALLPSAAADRATGYLALFMMGWSPMLWTFGLYLLNRGMPKHQSGVSARQAHSASAAKLKGSQSLLVKAEVALRRLYSKGKRSLGSVINPPLCGVIAGVVVGLSPLGPLLFLPLQSNTKMPLELKIVVGAARSVVDILQTMGGATLAVTTIVLGASMFPQNNTQQTAAEQATSGASHHTSSSSGQKRPLQWLRNVLPRDALEVRILATVGVARLLLVPSAAFCIVEGLAAVGLLPNDPVCKLVLLVEGSMPTAQNLVLLMNLHDNTRHMAEKAGRLMLRLYPIAIVPVTIWMTFFVQRMPVAISAL